MCRMQMRDLSMSINDIHAVLFIQERRGDKRGGKERRKEGRKGEEKRGEEWGRY